MKEGLSQLKELLWHGWTEVRMFMLSDTPKLCRVRLARPPQPRCCWWRRRSRTLCSPRCLRSLCCLRCATSAPCQAVVQAAQQRAAGQLETAAATLSQLLQVRPQHPEAVMLHAARQLLEAAYT